MKITQLLESGKYKADIHSIEIYLYKKIRDAIGKNVSRDALTRLKYAIRYLPADKAEKAKSDYAKTIKKLKHRIDLMMTLEELSRKMEFSREFEERAYTHFLGGLDDSYTWMEYLGLPNNSYVFDRGYVEEEAYNVLNFANERKEKERLASIGRKERQREVSDSAKWYSSRDIYDRADKEDAIKSVVNLDKNRKEMY